MNISKYIKLDESIKFKKRQLNKIKKNHPTKHLYVLCTPRKPGELFEIIEGKHIDETYKDTYVVAISYEYDWIVQYVVELVDLLYNKKELAYEQLKIKE